MTKIAQMDRRMISKERMLNKLKTAVDEAGGQKAWALANGVSAQYVCDCLKRRRDIGISIALSLGYVPVSVYVKAEMPAF